MRAELSAATPACRQVLAINTHSLVVHDDWGCREWAAVTTST